MKSFIHAFILFLFIPVCSNGQSVGDFRSFQTGSWSTVTTWETWNGTAWVAAGSVPTQASGVVTIRSPHVVSIVMTTTIDQVIVNTGATLQTSGGSTTLTINAGTGVDLQINGTFIDGATPAVIFNGTWNITAGASLVKTSASASNNWQSAYDGGIANIPSGANWILRKTATANPVLSSASAVYPNLTIENNTGTTWTTAGASSFTGTTVAPIIKGNLDIGGSGTGTVSFLSDFKQPAAYTQVQGNLVVRTGNTYRNFGNGTEVQGNVTCNGTISYDAADFRKFVFSGSNAQTVDGTGTFGIYDLTMNKTSGNVTLNRAITVDNLMTFTNGIMFTTNTNLLTINTNGSVSGANNSSFVSGPVKYIGTNAFTFPVGKNSDYQPIGISSSVASVTFWTEDFGSGCNQGNLATAYTGTNGAWTMTNTGTNDTEANTWFVSARENGNAAGACGSGCGTDRSLHLGNVAIPSFFLAADGGASYNAGGYCGLYFCTATDKRVESPVINCSAYSNITLSFVYMENGSGSTDNATLWYFDGASWSQLTDLAKTANTCSPQGIWTTYSTTLPASANGNANIKIGFRWVNNDDGVGSDPSFAVDDITLTQPGISSDFTAEYFYTNPQGTYGNNLAATIGQISSCEYWTLNRNSGTATKQVTLNWDANSCAVSSLSNIKVARYDGTSTWQDHGNASTTGSVSAGSVTSTMVSSFSPFTLGDIASPLPVELLDFDAQLAEKTVSLRWTTASEINSDIFEIQRSKDGKIFETIHTRDAAGFSNSVIDYSTYDLAPYPGVSYYRLKMTDQDGSYVYSQLRAIEIMDHEPNIQLSPNPLTGNEIHLDLFNFSKGNLQIVIRDMNGKTCYDKKFEIEDHAAKVLLQTGHSLAKGSYTVSVISQSGVIIKKLIVQ